jgi:hypothetical protein
MIAGFLSLLVGPSSRSYFPGPRMTKNRELNMITIVTVVIIAMLVADLKPS